MGRASQDISDSPILLPFAGTTAVRLTGITGSQDAPQPVALHSTTRKGSRVRTVAYTLTGLETNQLDTEWNAPRNRSRDRHTHRHTSQKPVIFVDGEGANVGEPTIWRGKHYQQQNYALLSAVFSSGEYRHIVGTNGTGRLSTRACLYLILGLPKTHIVVGYGIDYDVQQILYDVPAKYMKHLHENGFMRWKEFTICYKPHKSFSVSIIPHGSKNGTIKSKRARSCMVWDIAGFFQTRFDLAVEKWKIATPAEVEFLTRMKLKRSTFAGIDAEQLEYNRLEGTLGVRVFERIRDEWTKLQLPMRRYDGAGAIASAMFTQHGVHQFLHQSDPIPTDIMLRAYIGGRFDFSRQGFVGDSQEYDINSAYPHIARALPCLTHSEWRHTTRFIPDRYSLWHVRWNLPGVRWAPFPYRTLDGRIRYYCSGEGWYYGAEVERALQLYPGIEILEGYYLIRKCEHLPFGWISDYHRKRQEMKQRGDFGEQVIKFGLNAAYGKLAQTKGHIPKFQCLIWAGMITSGTRAMLLEAISHDPESVSVTATDAVITSRELPLSCDPAELGKWESTHLSDVFVVGNGLYHSADSRKERTRGFERSKLDWDRLRAVYRDSHRPFDFDIPATTFFGYVGAYIQSKWDLRCTWEHSRKILRVEVPEWKQERGGWLYPLPEPSGGCSGPARIAEANLRLDELEIVSSGEGEKLLEVLAGK